MYRHATSPTFRSSSKCKHRNNQHYIHTRSVEVFGSLKPSHLKPVAVVSSIPRGSLLLAPERPSRHTQSKFRFEKYPSTKDQQYQFSSSHFYDDSATHKIRKQKRTIKMLKRRLNFAKKHRTISSKKTSKMKSDSDACIDSDSLSSPAHLVSIYPEVCVEIVPGHLQNSSVHRISRNERISAHTNQDESFQPINDRIPCKEQLKSSSFRPIAHGEQTKARKTWKRVVSLLTNLRKGSHAAFATKLTNDAISRRDFCNQLSGMGSLSLTQSLGIVYDTLQRTRLLNLLATTPMASGLLTTELVTSLSKLVDYELIQVFTLDFSNPFILIERCESMIRKFASSPNKEHERKNTKTCGSLQHENEEISLHDKFFNDFQNSSSKTSLTRGSELIGESTTGLLGYILTTGKSVGYDVNDDVWKNGNVMEKKHARSHQAMFSLGDLHSLLAVPLDRDDNGNIVGVIIACNKRGGTDLAGTRMSLLREKEVLKGISGAITSRHLYFQTEYISSRDLAIKNELMNVTRFASKNKKDPVLVMKKAVECLVKVLRCDRVSLFQVDKVSNEQWLISSTVERASIRSPIGTGIAGYAIQSRCAVNVGNAEDDSKFNNSVDSESGYVTKTVLATPVLGNQADPIGVVEAINKVCSVCEDIPCRRHQVKFDHHDEVVIQSIAVELSAIIQQTSTLSKKIERRIAIKDKNLSQDTSRFIGQFIQKSGGASGASISCNLEPIEVEHSAINKYDPEIKQYKRISATEQINVPNIIRKSQSIMKSFQTWSFSYFPEEQNQHELLEVIVCVMKELEVGAMFNVEDSIFFNFFQQVCDMYRPVAYHNFTHAFNVFHISFMLLRTTGLGAVVGPLDTFALLVAALCHDIDHPGTNNEFQVNSGSSLAFLYNDQSVLEHHHAAKMWQILKEPDCNIFAQLNTDQYREVRRTTIMSILYTDMTKHQLLVTALENRQQVMTDSAQSSYLNSVQISASECSAVCSPISQIWNPKEVSDRLELCEIIIHLSDLSGPVLPFRMCKRFAEAIVEEFRCQSEIEKEMKIPQAAFNASDEISKAKLQLSFIGYVVEPLWLGISRICPQLSELIDNINENKRLWEIIARGEFVKQNAMDTEAVYSKIESKQKSIEQTKEIRRSSCL